jgi:hypothetical protein
LLFEQNEPVVVKVNEDTGVVKLEFVEFTAVADNE